MVSELSEPLPTAANLVPSTANHPPTMPPCDSAEEQGDNRRAVGRGISQMDRLTCTAAAFERRPANVAGQHRVPTRPPAQLPCSHVVAAWEGARIKSRAEGPHTVTPAKAGTVSPSLNCQTLAFLYTVTRCLAVTAEAAIGCLFRCKLSRRYDKKSDKLS